MASPREPHDCDWPEYRREFVKLVETQDLQKDELIGYGKQLTRITTVGACLTFIMPIVLVVVNHYWK